MCDEEKILEELGCSVDKVGDAVIITPEMESEEEEPAEAIAEEEPFNVTVVNSPRTGRNEACPCNSGKKFKKCCLNK